MTSEDIRKTTFEKGMRGYRVEDVDDFLLQVSKEVDALTAQLEEAIHDKEEMQNKLYILAEKVEEYRGQEDTLKTALINAQRMGETVVHEAKQKADAMVREASGKAQLLREQAEAEILGEQHALESMSAEVTRFKATILNLYKQHIESLSALEPPVEHANEFLAANSRKPGQAEKKQQLENEKKEPATTQNEALNAEAEPFAANPEQDAHPVKRETPSLADTAMFEGIVIEEAE